MALELHPDKGGDPEKFQELQEMKVRGTANRTGEDLKTMTIPMVNAENPCLEDDILNNGDDNTWDFFCILLISIYQSGERN